MSYVQYLKLAISICLLISFLFSSSQEKVEAISNKSFDQVERIFRESYQSNIRERFSQLGSFEKPIILVSADKLYLYDGRHKKEEYQILSEKYFNYAKFTHIPFSIHLQTNLHLDEELNDHKILTLTKLKDVLSRLKKENFDADETKSIEEIIINSSLVFVKKILKDREVLSNDLEAFSNKMKPLIEFLYDEAAKESIVSLHKTSSQIYKKLGKEKWDNTTVIINGSYQNRYGSPAESYFKKVFNDDKRIVYLETLFSPNSERDALGQFVRLKADDRLAKDFVDQNYNIQQDALALGAAKKIKELEESRAFEELYSKNISYTKETQSYDTNNQYVVVPAEIK